MFKNRDFKSTFLVFLFFGLGLIPFQNCGQVKLQSALNKSLGTVVSDPEPTYLKPPTADNTLFRAAFTIDMSFSMRGDACVFAMHPPEDAMDLVDAGNPRDRDTQNCDAPTGVDVSYKRILVAKKWIKETETILKLKSNYDAANTFKIMISPFSGPKSEAEFGLGRPLAEAKMFLSVKKALLLLAKLEYIHSCYVGSCAVDPGLDAENTAAMTSWTASSRWDEGRSVLFMGTSLPKYAIERMHDALEDELNKIKTAGLESQARFEIVHLSDGVPKPLPEHIVKAAKIIWEDKFKKCLTDRPLHSIENTCADKLLTVLNSAAGIQQLSPYGIRCDIDIGYTNVFHDCFADLNGYSSLYCEEQPGGGCASNDNDALETTVNVPCVINEDDGLCHPTYNKGFLDQVNNYWGNPADNKMINIFKKLKLLKNLFTRQHPQVQFRHSFIRVDAETSSLKTYVAQLADEKINWIERSKRVFFSNYRYHLLNASKANGKDVDLPFPLFPSMSSADSYRIKHFSAVNLNSRVNANRQVSADSDADGLLDEEDPFPTKPRSDGYCLDLISLKRMGGCVKLNCDPLVDVDGDGLNSCDENTIKTSDLDFDSDDDGIPDGIEILKGFNPLQSDLLVDDNNDGLSNFNNYEIGMPSWLEPSAVPAQFHSNIGVSFIGYSSRTDELGNSVQVPGYHIMLESMPLVMSQGVSTEAPSYKSLLKEDSARWPYNLTAGAHNANENIVLIIGKVENYQNPKDFYWVTKKIIIPFGDPVKITFDLQLVEYRIVPDPVGSEK